MSESHGIPTMYSGIQFRSRLEARYALLFDALGLTWHYEPLDLAGYVPDYIVAVQFARDRRSTYDKMVFEVRPETDVLAAIEKISRSGWQHAACVVTATPFTTPAGYVLGYATDLVTLRDHDCAASNVNPWHPFGYQASVRALTWGGGDDLTAEWKTAGNRSQWQASTGKVRP